MKGSKPAGTTTQTTINPTQQAQLPFLQQGWGSAQSLYNNQPVMPYYPGATMAPWNPAVQQGYQDVYNTGASIDQGLRPQTNAAYNTAVTGGYGVNNSPAYSAYQSFAQGTNPNQQNLYNLQNTALNSGNYYANAIGGYANPLMGFANAAGGGNLGLSALGGVAQGQGAGMQQLAQTAGGAYLNCNPYLAAMVQAAADPVTRNYQTATAPQADYNFANAGRYGSGAMLGARSTNEQNLGKTLADQSSNLYGQNYSNERARQDAAASSYAGLQAQAGQGYGNLYNQGLGLGMQGALNAANVTNQAGNQYSQGLNSAQNAIQNLMASQQYGATGLQSGYQSGNSAAIQALSQYPQFAQAQFIPARSALEAGQGLTAMDQATIADQMKRYYGEQNAPWDTLAKYMSTIGQYTQGSHSDTSPYFQNQTANLLSGLGGTLGIGQQLFGGSSSSGGLLGGLFGGGTASGFGDISAGGLSSLLGDSAAAEGLAASTGLDFGSLLMMGLI